MDYLKIPSSYKNYLPSKNMQRTVITIITLVLVVGAGYFLMTNKKISSLLTKTVAPPEPLVVVGSTPVRSTLHDGIPDWQKILVGLDPTDPKSTVLFQARKAALEQEGVWNNVNTVSESDQLGLEIGNQLSQQQTVTDATIDQETSQAVLAYVGQLDASLKKYNRVDIEEDPLSNRDAETAYAQKLESTMQGFTAIQNNQELIQKYFSGEENKTSVLPVMNDLSRLVKDLIAIPVPSPSYENHLNFINSIYALYQILDTFESYSGSDDIRKFAVITLFQDKLNDVGKFWLYINTYFILSTEPSTL